MRFSIRYADKIVGALVILAIGILIFVIVMLGTNQRWFIKDSQYRTYFTSASGISPNMPIHYKGFPIGHVKQLSLSDDDRVEIIFTIFKEFTPRVKEGSLVEVMESPIGLGSSFVFYPGKGIEQIPDGDVIPEVTSPEARLYIARGMAEIPPPTDSISNIINSVNTLLDTINISLSGSMGSEQLLLGQILYDLQETILSVNPLLDDLQDTITSINPILEQAADPFGTVMMALDGQGAVYQSLESSIIDVAGIIENLNKTSDLIPTQAAVLINEVNSTLRVVHDVLIAVANNPLLRGGIPERTETGPGGANPRNLDF